MDGKYAAAIVLATSILIAAAFLVAADAPAFPLSMHGWRAVYWSSSEKATHLAPVFFMAACAFVALASILFPPTQNYL
ncbi:MAG: hypothetical protein ABIC95_05765 [archaeon]